MNRHYDVLVIGSGGGTKISTPASKMGLKAAIIEKDRLGGTCLNRGCIPSKMLIHPAEVAHQIDTAGLFDIQNKGYTVDFMALVKRVAATIDEESDSILPGYRSNENLDFYHGEARFTAPRTVQVRGYTLTADKVYIATGSRPQIPNIKGLAETPFMTSKEALRPEKQPAKLLVLGAGYIATELAFFYASLGSEVHLVARSSVLRHEDSEIAAEFTRAFAKRRNINIHLHTATHAVSHDGSLFHLMLTDKDGQPFTLSGDALLVATGVVPNSDRLDLEAAGVALGKGGYIKVDDRLRTTAPNTWALGDVVGNYLFRHSVNLEGEYLFENTVRNPADIPVDYGPMPHAVFSSPQIAGVGETEDQLKARGAVYIKALNNYAASAMGMALRAHEGFVKMLVDPQTRRFLGCHIVGHEASVLIHQIITLMRMNGTVDDLLSSVFIHPALNEIVRNAARKVKQQLDP